MGYLIQNKKSGRFILSDDLTVINYEFAHIFETRKQAWNYMREYTLINQEFDIIEEEQVISSFIERLNLVDDIFED